MAAPPAIRAYGLKWILINNNVSRHVLYKVLCLGTPMKRDDQDLLDYLDNLPPDSTANYLTANHEQRKFTEHQKEKIAINKQCNKYDITLLFKVIRLANENVAPLNNAVWGKAGNGLEYYVYKVKEERNSAMHGDLEITEAELKNKADALQVLLERTLNAAKGRYDSDFSDAQLDEETQRVIDGINDVINKNLCEEELINYCSSSLIEKVSVECMEELRANLPTLGSYNPVSFLDADLVLTVSEIFTDIEIANIGVPDNVPYQEILAVIKNSVPPRNVNVAMLEGLVGTGKSILIAQLVQQWCDQSNVITDLYKYEVVLYVDCQNTHSSFEQLLQKFLPHNCLKYGSLLKTLLKHCRILVAIDGFDQATSQSKDLVNELLDQLQFQDATILCTSRPESTSDFKSMVLRKIASMTHMRIKGISPENRVSLAQKTHEKMKVQTGSGRDTDGLVKLMERVSPCEHYRVPLNLTLATWLYDQDPDRVNKNTTQTELYYYTHLLHQQKLHQRLLNNELTKNMTRRMRERTVRKWLPHLYQEGLITPRMEKVDKDKLVDKCEKHKLPENEMLSAFLSLKINKTLMGPDEVYLAPHGALQDYYAALYIVNRLPTQPGPNKVLSVMQEAIPSFQVEDLPTYQNIIQQVAGLLYLPPPHGPLVPDADTVAEEVISLLHQAGVRNRDQWLDVVEDTRISPAIYTAIARYFPTDVDIVVEDGRVRSYAALLPYLQKTRVEINIKSKNVSLDLLPEALNNHTCTALRLQDHFRNPLTTSLQADQMLEYVLSRNVLEVFVGNVSVEMVPHLPSTLTSLYVALSSDPLAETLLPYLSSLPHLHHLGVHVTAGISPAYLQHLPRIQNIILYLSDVTEGQEAWAAEVSLQLQSPSGYRSIRFPGVELTREVWENLVNKLQEKDVNIVGEDGTSRPFPMDEEPEEHMDWD